MEKHLVKMKIDIKEILFWIFLVLSLVFLIWIVFGNSPTELIFIVTIYLTLLLKMWSISDKQIRTDGKINKLKDSFSRMVEDLKYLREHLIK